MFCLVEANCNEAIASKDIPIFKSSSAYQRLRKNSCTSLSVTRQLACKLLRSVPFLQLLLSHILAL